VPPTPKVHYRQAGRQTAACNLPSWLPDTEATGNLLLVTCGMCHRTRLYRDAIAAQARWTRHELAGQAVLNPELIIRGVM
jgi:hypothetical protein